MSDPDGNKNILLTLKSLDARVTSLEAPAKKSALKRLTESASASALFLGLILTFLSVYDVVVVKPEADRINRLSKFNDAVNSAARIRQDLLQSQFQTGNPQLQIAIASAAQPQILNNISTARAMLRDMSRNDVGISQLIILIAEALNIGDLDSAKGFVARAVEKTDVTPYLRSEAKRYEGRYFFIVEKPDEGRSSYESAERILGDSPAAAMQRAYILSDLLLIEFTLGDCNKAKEEFERLSAMLKAPGVLPQAKDQMTATVKAQMFQLQGQHCPAIPEVANF